MILSSIKVDPAPPIQEDVKARVSEMLEKMPSIGLKLLDEDVEDLQDLVSQGDPTAAFLLGSAIWSGLAPPPDGVDQFLVVAGTDHGKGESRQRWTCLHVGAPRWQLPVELRARSALRYLEFAMKADIKAAAERLMRVHDTLSGLYMEQALQYRSMGSLPKEEK
jgi:hypothetical protein